MALSPMSRVGLKVIKILSTLKMPWRCQIRPFVQLKTTSRDPDEIAEALKMLNLDTDINLFQDSIDDFGDMMDDF